MKDHISTAPRAEQAIRGIPLNQLVLDPENVQKTPADKASRAVEEYHTIATTDDRKQDGLDWPVTA